MILSVFANHRVNPLLEVSSHIRDPSNPAKVNQLARIAQAALPFLTLYQPTGILATLGLGIGRSISLIQHLAQATQTGDSYYFAKEFFHLVLVISTLALTILAPFFKVNPLVNIALSQGYQFFRDLFNLMRCLDDHEWQEAVQAALSMMSSLIYFASLMYAAPETIALSMIIQALLEIYKASGEFSKKEGDWLMIASNLLIAAIRGYQAVPYLQTSHRNWFGKQMTQKEWQEIYKEIKEYKTQEGEKFINFEALLTKYYYSNFIKNIDFSETGDLSRIIFKDIRFSQCHLSETLWSHNIFQNISFNHCGVFRTRMINCFFQNTSFWACQAREADFKRSFFDHVHFTYTNFSGAFFSDTSLHRVTFLGSRLFQTNFSRASIHHSHMIGSDLTAALFTGNKEQFTYWFSKQKMIHAPASFAGNEEGPHSFVKSMRDSFKQKNMRVGEKRASEIK